MIIFSLLIALLIDRALRNRGHWQLKPIADTWCEHYMRWALPHSWAQHPVVAVLAWVLPAIILALLVFLQGSVLLALIVNVLVLVISLGTADKRDLVRRYLGHAHHGQGLPCAELQQQLEQLHPELSGHGVGAHIIWLNFRYYFAVIFWFIIFGALGALVYALLREYVVNRYAERFAEEGLTEEGLTTQQGQWFATTLYILEWPAARVAGFAYLLVGHFSRAFPVWARGAGSLQPHASYLAQVASRAEDAVRYEPELCSEPSAMLTLAKRSIILLLAAAAIATLFGWLV